MLPAELLDDVCQHSSLTDLVSLSRTSSLFYVVTQRLLYRHISIDFTSRNLRVVLTLAEKPYVARHVRTFAIRLDSCTTVLHSYYRRLTDALSNMAELTSLDIFVEPTASWVLRTQCNVKFPRLRHFASSFPLDSYVIHFLCKAEAILQLEVDSLPTSHLVAPSSLTITAIPRLSRFIGSSEAAQAVIPGRPVEEIHLNSGDLTEGVVQGLAASTAYVLLLSASTSSFPLPLLGKLAEFMPQLKYLRIITTYDFLQLDALDVVSLLSIFWNPPSHDICRCFTKTLQSLWRHSLTFILLNFLECAGTHRAKMKEGSGSRNRSASHPLTWIPPMSLTSISHIDSSLNSVSTTINTKQNLSCSCLLQIIVSPRMVLGYLPLCFAYFGLLKSTLESP